MYSIWEVAQDHDIDKKKNYLPANIFPFGFNNYNESFCNTTTTKRGLIGGRFAARETTNAGAVPR